MKESESKQEACCLELTNGLHKDPLFLNYDQNFVKAPNQGKHPCNYAAEKVPVNSFAMKISMGK